MVDVTLTGKVTGIRHVNPNDGYSVFMLGDVVEGGEPRGACKVVGRAPGLAVGSLVTAVGQWATRTIAGRPQQQLSASEVTVGEPAAVAGPDPARDLMPLLRATHEALGEANGNTTVRIARLVDSLTLAAGCDVALAEAAVALAIADDDFVLHGIEGVPHLAASDMFEVERRVAEGLVRLSRGRLPWDARKALAAVEGAGRAIGVRPVPSQERALATVLSSKVSVMTGTAGTGKTSMLSIIVRVLSGLGRRFVLGAPTGKAARRMSATTGCEARTIHQMLEVRGSDGSFKRHRGNPLEADVVILDETSMLDVRLMASLLDAIPDGAALLMVGDAEQLTPVGAGQVLLDMVESGTVPVARLTETQRQGATSLIVHNSQRVLAGEMPEVAVRGLADDYREIETQSSEETREVVIRLLAEGVEGFDLSDVQVIAPQSNGAAGTASLNAALRAELNPGATGEFSVGDRVMATENDRDARINNGDTGTVVAVARRGAEVTVDFGEVVATFKGKALEGLIPAYAVTVHKMQGSEQRCCVVVVSNEHSHMLSRRLLMTAMTRASELTLVVGQRDALRRAVSRVERKRVTTLRPRLEAALAAGRVAVA